MSLIKQIKLENSLYDIGANWSNIDKENIFYDFNNMISFTSKEKKMLKSCVVNIESNSSTYGSGWIVDGNEVNFNQNETRSSILIYTSSKNLYPLRKINYNFSGITITSENGICYVNGTPTKDIDWIDLGSVTLQPGEYIISGCATDATEQSGQLAFYAYNNYEDNELLATLTAETPEITVTLNKRSEVAFYFKFTSGVTLNNQIYKPMIRLASEADNTFIPFDGAIYETYIGNIQQAYTGQLNALKGELLVSSVERLLNGSENWTEQSSGENKFYQLIDNTVAVDENQKWYGSSHFSNAIITEDTTEPGVYVYTPEGSNNSILNFRPDSFFGITNLSQWCSFLFNWEDIDEYGDPVYCYWKTTNFTVYQVEAQPIFTLIGKNYIWTNCGDISIELENFYSDIENEITTNLTENKLLYNKNNSILPSQHTITLDKLGINGKIESDYTLTIHGNTLIESELIASSFSMKNSQNQIFNLKFSRAGTYLSFWGDNIDIGWNWTNIDGAGIGLRSSKLKSSSTASSSQPGQFLIYARKPNNETPTAVDATGLYGYPDGLLTWVPMSGTETSNPQFAIGAMSSSNYTLYVNGPSYTKGNLDIAATTGTTQCSLQYNDILNTLNFVFT